MSEVFDKLSKQLFKKYQSSKVFKELVQPMSMKTASFMLRKGDAIKYTPEQKGCC